jgi:hypothetical protein
VDNSVLCDFNLTRNTQLYRNGMNYSSKYRRTIWALAVAVDLMLIFSGCGRNGGREVQGNVLFLRGTVTIDGGKEGARHPQPLAIGSMLSVGDRLETSPDSVAALLLIPGIFIEAGAGTEIIIGDLRVEKRGDAMVNAMKSRLAAVRQNRGVIYASLPNVGLGSCELSVQTDLGTLAAQRGAIVAVRLTSEAVRVICVDGEVQWSGARGGRVDEISQGYFRDYRRHDVPHGDLKTEPTPITEDAGAQNDVATALETAAGFDEFALRARNAPPLKSSIPIERRTFRPP